MVNDAGMQEAMQVALDLKGIKAKLAQLGVSQTAYIRRADLSSPTLERLHAGLRVRSTTIGKARRTFAEIKAEVKAQDPDYYRQASATK